jgi:hypothetical protein
MVRHLLVLVCASLVNCHGAGGVQPSADGGGADGTHGADASAKPPALVGLAVNESALAAPGNQGFEDAASLMVASGGNAFLTSATWHDVELTSGQISFQNGLDGPVSLIVSAHPEITGVVYVLKMIDSNIRVMPDDLQSLSFDDATVVMRFQNLIDALAADPASARISHILLGNEVDGYLSQHPDEEAAFETLLEAGIDRVHLKLPNAKVATIVTAGGARSSPALIAALNAHTDFVSYTYYPDDGDILGNAPLQMKPIAEIDADLQFLADSAGAKPFAFTEIGCSSTTAYASSEDLQAQFVTEVFRIFKPSRDLGQVAFMIYQLIYDYAPDLCGPYAAAQGVSPDAICPLMNGAGLRNYSDGTPKKSWNVFLDALQNW